MIRLAIRGKKKTISVNCGISALILLLYWIVTCLNNIHISIFLGKRDDIIGKITIPDYRIVFFIEKAEIMDVPTTSLLK